MRDFEGLFDLLIIVKILFVILEIFALLVILLYSVGHRWSSIRNRINLRRHLLRTLQKFVHSCSRRQQLQRPFTNRNEIQTVHSGHCRSAALGIKLLYSVGHRWSPIPLTSFYQGGHATILQLELNIFLRYLSNSVRFNNICQ